MSQVLPEFVNKIVNKVTSNNTAPGTNKMTSVATPQPNAGSNTNNLGGENDFEDELDELNNLGPVNNNTTLTSSKKSNSRSSVSSSSNNKKSSVSRSGSNNIKLDNLTNAGSMRELLDSVMSSNLSVDKRNRLLNVIKTALISTQAQENQAFDKFSARYDFTNPNYMSGMGQGTNIQHQQPYYNNNMMFAPPPYYNPGMQMAYLPNMMPGGPNMMSGGPNMMYDVLFNKMNMMQMEMADLTRHLRDYTRRYMDNMRESDMDQIKNYIDELTRVQESVNEVTNTASIPEEPEETTPSSIMDKAKSTLKSGLSTVTNTVNSIGSTLGLTNSKAETPTPAPEPTPAPVEPAKPKDNNMMTLEDYDNELNTQPAEQTPAPVPAPANQNNAKYRTGLLRIDSAPKPATQPPDELSNAISELNQKNQAKQTGGGRKRVMQTKKETSILDQFERMISMTKNKSKKARKIKLNK
jgi:hypothetical protein